MVPSLVVNAMVVVALLAFYAGILRDFGTTVEFIHVRLGIGISLGSYVATGAAGLLSLAVIAVSAGNRHLAGEEHLAVAGYAGGLLVVFVLGFLLFFRFGAAIYVLLLRVGLKFY